MSVQYTDGSFSETMPLDEAIEEFQDALNQGTARALYVGTENEVEQIKKRKALEDQISEMPITDKDNDPLKYWGNKAPICPWCDAEIDISNNELWDLYEEDEHCIECPFCEKEIRVVSSATWTFSTDEQDIG